MRIQGTPKKLVLVLSHSLVKMRVSLRKWTYKPHETTGIITPEKNFLALPIILRSKPSSCLGVGYTDHTYIKEQLHFKLKLKVKIDAHGKKKV